MPAATAAATTAAPGTAPPRREGRARPSPAGARLDASAAFARRDSLLIVWSRIGGTIPVGRHRRGDHSAKEMQECKPEPVLTLFLFQGSMTAIYLRDPGGNLVEVASYG